MDQISDYPVNIDGQGNRSLLPGDLIYEDVNGDKIINALDQRPIGYAVGGSSYSNQVGTRVGGSTLTPIIAYGLNSSFQWKSFNLVANFAGGAMQTFIMAADLKIPFNSNGASTRNLITDRWHRADPFDANSAWIPGHYPPTRKDVTSHSNFNKTNDFYTINIAYMRLRDLEIGYNLPESLLKKIKIESQIGRAHV